MYHTYGRIELRNLDLGTSPTVINAECLEIHAATAQKLVIKGYNFVIISSSTSA